MTSTATDPPIPLRLTAGPPSAGREVKIPSNMMDQMGLSEGSVVGIRGRRTTLGQARESGRSSGAVVCDVFVHRSGGEPDLVTLASTPSQPAEEVEIEPLLPPHSTVTLGPTMTESALRKEILGTPLLTGDMFFFPSVQIRSIPVVFCVVGTRPRGPVRVHPSTRLTIELNAYRNVWYDVVGSFMDDGPAAWRLKQTSTG